MRLSQPLQQLHCTLEIFYDEYRSGKISEAEYLCAARKIDKEIDRLELAIFQEIPCLKVSF